MHIHVYCILHCIFIFQQYSAQLIQYKSDNFGGFKVDKVLEEIKRGQYLVSDDIC